MFTKFYFNQFLTSRFKSFVFLVLTLTCIQTNLKAQKSSFKANLMNIEAATNETFRYNTTLQNASSTTNIYELKADLPTGWSVTYRVDGSQVTSLSIDPEKTREIAVEINSTPTADPNKYEIPIRAISKSDTTLLQLEAVVKGSYGLSLSTPSGRLSEELTSGSNKQIQLALKNTGTLALNDISLSSQLPNNWQATFEPSQVKNLAPGKELNITVNLTVPDKTIVGDYAATFTASNSNSNTSAAFRFIVKTSLLSGWIGIVVILVALASVYYLIRKYGRR